MSGDKVIKEKRRKKRKFKNVLLVLPIIAIVLAVMAFIAIKVFTVENVEVEGNELYSDQIIKDTVLNDEYSWNTLYVFLKYKFNDTNQVPFIDTMEVSMKIPHTINIKVYEKGMLGYVYIDSIGQNAYFDKDGVVVETSANVIEGVPKVTGLTVSEVLLYEPLQIDTSVLKTLLNLSQTLSKYKLVPEAIDYAANGTIQMTYGEIGISFGNNENMNEKVERLQYIIPSLDGMKGTLHMEKWTEETTDITFEKSE